MVIHFNKTLSKSIENINLQKHHQFLIHEQEHPADHTEIFEDYKDAKWKIIDLLNEHCNSTPENYFDLYHWLNSEEEEEEEKEAKEREKIKEKIIKEGETEGKKKKMKWLIFLTKLDQTAYTIQNLKPHINFICG